ncbi:hypothetical protein Tsubulata_019208 [Turnera subulata]|uniref:Uncharacterized protein n=1 Tax=Turnera subulata TaxID=218843 RepID=A0A9Q0G0F3_9ROSI|nr:hypothetical protein Tsubulata_019208 [Turnera subulata]
MSAEKVAVDLKFLFSLLTNNLMMRMAVGHRLIEEQHAYTDMEKQAYLELVKALGIWRNGKDNSKNQQGKRSVQNLVDQVRSSRIHSPPPLNTGHHDHELRKGSSLVETLLSMQESEPDCYSYEVIKTILIVSIYIVYRQLTFYFSLFIYNLSIVQSANIYAAHTTAVQK